MKLAVWCLLAVISAQPVLGEDPDFDYGRASDMRGAKTIYIDTGFDLNTRNDLADRIEKSTSLHVVPKDESPTLTLVWVAPDENCGKARVFRDRPGKRPLLVFDWNDCGKRFVPATFLFVRKFAAAFNDSNR